MTTKRLRCTIQPLFCSVWWRAKAGSFCLVLGHHLQDGGGKKKYSDFSMCSHLAASIISSLNRERPPHLFFWTQKELAAVDWKELCPANFRWLLPKAHSGCCVVLVAEGRWLISLQQHQRAQSRETPAPSLSSSLSAGKTSWSFYTPNYWGLFFF